MGEKDRYFSKEEHESGPDQSINIDVFRRIKSDPMITKDEMVFSFFYVTNEKQKAKRLVEFIEKYESNQRVIGLDLVNETWEVFGHSYPIKLEINCINIWEKRMWDIGYEFDCKLDGWETTIEDGIQG